MSNRLNHFINFKLIFILFVSISAYAQLKQEKKGYYLEDQIYFKFSYNILNKKPKGVSQSGFSNSFSIGFIRDLPINKQRNFGFGVGLGYGFQTYFHNLKIYPENGQTVFNFFDEEYKSNKLKLNQLEIPLEIRWRTSTIKKYKFWRIYSGIKFNYLFLSKSLFKTDKKYVYKNVKAINKLQYGLTLATGYGNWNFFMYYGLTPLFKNASIQNNKITTKELKFGLQFYIL